MTYLTTSFQDISVVYTDELDGGGATFGQDYLRIVSKVVQRPSRVLEWCAGPAFIGFSLLANHLCDELVLVDINPLAVAACEETIRGTIFLL